MANLEGNELLDIELVILENLKDYIQELSSFVYRYFSD